MKLRIKSERLLFFALGALPLTAGALLVAFLIAGILARFTGFRLFVFGIAGALALFALFTVLRKVLGTVGVFGARGPGALAAQMAAGAIAGVIFARLTRPGPRYSSQR